MTRRGFTMIEIAIVLAIMIILTGPIFLQEQKMRGAMQTLAERADAHQEARQMMARIERDVKGGEVQLTPRLDGYTGKDVTCALDGGRLMRNGQPLGRLAVEDFVIHREGRTLFITLAVRSGQGRWTMVSRVDRP